jgi:hypothetical protein
LINFARARQDRSWGFDRRQQETATLASDGLALLLDLICYSAVTSFAQSYTDA